MYSTCLYFSPLHVLKLPGLQPVLPHLWLFVAWYSVGVVSAVDASPSDQFGLLCRSLPSSRPFSWAAYFLSTAPRYARLVQVVPSRRVGVWRSELSWLMSVPRCSSVRREVRMRTETKVETCCHMRLLPPLGLFLGQLQLRK